MDMLLLCLSTFAGGLGLCMLCCGCYIGCCRCFDVAVVGVVGVVASVSVFVGGGHVISHADSSLHA